MKTELEQKESNLKGLEQNLNQLQEELKNKRKSLEEKIILFEKLEKEEGNRLL
jgi:hypothetical protein